MTGSWREKKYALKTESTNCGRAFGEVSVDGMSTNWQVFHSSSLVIPPAVPFYRKENGSSER